MMSFKSMMKIHLIVAGMVFPIILMFFITGALYTADIEPDYEEIEWRIRLEEPIVRDLEQLEALARQELANKDYAVPLGRPRIEDDEDRDSFIMLWWGVNHEITIRPSSGDNQIAVIEMWFPSWYERFWQLHKAYGNDIFDYFVILQSILMALLLFSGVAMGLIAKAHRVRTLLSLTGGFVLFFLLMLGSKF